MPRGDGTGPNGMGPVTGRGAGFCTGNAVPGFMNPVPGRGGGFGGGRGFGRGLGLGFRGGRGRGFGWGIPAVAPEPTAQQELDVLKNQAESLAATLSRIQQRVSELETEKTDS